MKLYEITYPVQGEYYLETVALPANSIVRLIKSFAKLPEFQMSHIGHQDLVLCDESDPKKLPEKRWFLTFYKNRMSYKVRTIQVFEDSEIVQDYLNGKLAIENYDEKNTNKQ